MKWDFFDDGYEGKPYESIDDWYREIKHLVWPTIILLAAGVAMYVYITCFHY